jgi:LPXTG-motif cell wall-anchored protein
MNNRLTLGAAALIASITLFATAGVASAATPKYTPELVFTLHPDGIIAGGPVIADMVSFGDLLAFETNEGTMYVSDGTSAGTHDLSSALDLAGVSDIHLTRDEVNQYSLDINGELLFWGFDANSERWELFTTNGTTVEQVTDGLNGQGDIYFLDGEIYVANQNTDEFVTVDLVTGDFVVIQGSYDCGIYTAKTSAVSVNGRILFHYDDGDCDDHIAVWDTATPNIGAVPLLASEGGLGSHPLDPNYLNNEDYINFYVFEGEAYFSAFANDANGHFLGWELFTTDGTQSGTKLLKDIAPGSDDSYSGSPYRMTFTEFNGELYFYVYDGSDDLLYKTDGTSVGTVEVAMGSFFDPGDASEGPGTILNGRMITTFDGGNDDDWASTDGTAAGTEFLIDDGTDADNNACWDSCTPAVLFDGHAFFMGYDGDVNGIWVSDGTRVGTDQVTDSNFSVSEYGISDYADQAPLVVAGDNLYFALSDWEGTGASALYKIVKAGLANTGADATGTLWVGFGLVGAGVAAVAVRRRRA